MALPRYAARDGKDHAHEPTVTNMTEDYQIIRKADIIQSPEIKGAALRYRLEDSFYGTASLLGSIILPARLSKLRDLEMVKDNRVIDKLEHCFVTTIRPKQVRVAEGEGTKETSTDS